MEDDIKNVSYDLLVTARKELQLLKSECMDRNFRLGLWKDLHRYFQATYIFEAWRTG